MARTIREWLFRVHAPELKGEVVSESRLCFAPEIERYAIEEKGSPHENAVKILQVLASGQGRPSFLQTKEAAGLVLQMLETLQGKLSYMTCHKHGAIHALSAWRCPSCYDEINMELEAKK